MPPSATDLGWLEDQGAINVVVSLKDLDSTEDN